MFDRILQWSHMTLGFSLLGDFLFILFSFFITDSVSLLIIDFLFLYDSVIIFFYFWDISSNGSSFIFYFIEVFFFSLISLAKDLSVLLIYAKKQLLVSFIFFYCLSSLYFISVIIFITSFLLLTLGLIFSSFSNSLRYKIRLFIWYHSYLM